MEQSNEKDVEPNYTPTEDEFSSRTLEKGETLDKFIDKESHFRRTKKKILNELTPPLSDYIKPFYPLNKKNPKREMEVVV